MPKIKHIARFTTPVKLDTIPQTHMESAPVSERMLSLGLQKHIEKMKQGHAQLLDLIEKCLEESSQPLSATEVSELFNINHGRRIDQTTIRLHLAELEKSNRISSRVETMTERVLRTGGKKARALNAKLWWAPAGLVPQRTITEAVPGVLLVESTGRKKKPAASVIPSVSKTTPVVDDSTLIKQNPVIDYLIDRIVAERTQELQEELTKTKEELTRVRTALKSVVGDL